MLRMVESFLKYVTGKARTQSTMLYAFLNGTLGNPAFTPKHIAFCPLAPQAIHLLLPFTVSAVCTTS